MSPYEPLLKSVEKTAATEEASLFGGGTDAWETVVGTVLLLDELGFVLGRDSLSWPQEDGLRWLHLRGGGVSF